jgi:enoyl-ACP reductase-like protein
MFGQSPQCFCLECGNELQPFNVTRLSIPYLKQSGSGVIIIMSSLAGRFGYPDRSPYATTKWGLIGLTKTLSIELGEADIRVNAILPGAVEGPRLQHVFEGRASASGKSIAEVTKEALANQSIKRFVDPRDIAALAMFLASDSARSISGQMIPIDGDSQTIYCKHIWPSDRKPNFPITGILMALDKDNGKILWQFNMGSAIGIGGPSIGNGMLFVPTGVSHGPIGSLVAFGLP